MTMVLAPTSDQERLAELGLINVLVIAPAGCGKTEALAARAAAVCDRGDVSPPRKVLAATFSNKAKDNLASRMRAVIGPGWRERVTVTNFHGIAGRLLRAHGDQIGVARDVVFPEKAWLGRARASLGITYKSSEPFDAALRRAKRDAVDDDVVMERLIELGHKEAIEFERRLREESRLDYDDLLRHAARLLAIPDVVRLYRAQFGMVMVDEVQDLTMMQLEMVQALGGDHVTYAGDPAQGIYSFAGAQPDAVFAAIRARDPEVIEFDESYRSSPAVLDAVNVLADQLGSTRLRCADPDRWPDQGHVVMLKRPTTSEEAKALADEVQRVLARHEGASIGVVVRRQTRLADFKQLLIEREVHFEDWGAPTHVPKVIELLKRFVCEATAADVPASEQLDLLEETCRAQLEESDVTGLDEVNAACDALRALVDGGLTLESAVATCRSAPATDKPVAPGLHLLTGHVGKGQEFDWVVVLGLEDGQIPDFRAEDAEALAEELRVLHVMVSRAGYGLVLTYAASTTNNYGTWSMQPCSMTARRSRSCRRNGTSPTRSTSRWFGMFRGEGSEPARSVSMRPRRTRSTCLRTRSAELTCSARASGATTGLARTSRQTSPTGLTVPSECASRRE
jgi:DNA helicase-2/ATP-dependent DNA helicase PcrA